MAAPISSILGKVAVSASSARRSLTPGYSQENTTFYVGVSASIPPRQIMTATTDTTDVDEVDIHVLKTASRNPTMSPRDIALKVNERVKNRASVDEDDVVQTIEEKSLPAPFDDPENTDLPPAADTDKVRTLFEDDEDLRDRAAHREGDYLDEVQDAARQRWGDRFVPGVQTIYNIIREVREEMRLDEDEEEDKGDEPDDVTTAHGEPDEDDTQEPRTSLEDLDHETKIQYRCNICGYGEGIDRFVTEKDIRRHVTTSEDMDHRKRDGSEPGVVKVIGEEAPQPEAPRGVVEDGFDLVWAIHNNPGATRKEIAELLDVSQGTVTNRANRLGLDWKNREEEAEELLSEWGVFNGDDEQEEETVERQSGNASYSGPATGLDQTMSHLSEVTDATQPETQIATMGVSLGDLYAIISTCEYEPLRKRALATLLRNFDETDLPEDWLTTSENGDTARR